VVTRRSESRGAAKKSDAVPRSMVAQLNEPKSKLTDLAYQMIEEAIVTLRIRPGTALSEQALSEMTGIGRTPIREAIQRLAREHLVLVLPQRGLLVSEMNVNKQLKLLETRREIERLICRSAAKRASDSERQSFRRLADEFTKYAARSDDVAFVRADREFNELCHQCGKQRIRGRCDAHAARVVAAILVPALQANGRHARNGSPARCRRRWRLAKATSKHAGEALDRLIDHLEGFTRATVL
jgi:DNA-binding GntR family transcriptional regulator